MQQVLYQDSNNKFLRMHKAESLKRKEMKLRMFVLIFPTTWLRRSIFGPTELDDLSLCMFE